MKKYYHYKGIKWAISALAQALDCKHDEVEGVLAKLKADKKKKAASIPTAAEVRKTVAAVMHSTPTESAPSEAIEETPLTEDTDGTEIAIVHTNGNGGTFDDVNAAAIFLDCQESQVISALSRGSWKARKIARIVRVAVA